MSRCVAPFCRCETPCPLFGLEAELPSEGMADDEPEYDDVAGFYFPELLEPGDAPLPVDLEGPVDPEAGPVFEPIPIGPELTVQVHQVVDVESLRTVEAGAGAPPFDGVRVVAADGRERLELAVEFRWRFLADGTAIAEIRDLEGEWHVIGWCSHEHAR